MAHKLANDVVTYGSLAFGAFILYKWWQSGSLTTAVNSTVPNNPLATYAAAVRSNPVGFIQNLSKSDWMNYNASQKSFVKQAASLNPQAQTLLRQKLKMWAKKPLKARNANISPVRTNPPGANNFIYDPFANPGSSNGPSEYYNVAGK